MNWSNFKLERFAVVLLALGAGITMFLKVINSGAPALPLKTRQEIVAADRAFLEGAPLESRASSLVTQGLEPASDKGPGVANIVGDRCYGKACVTVSLQTNCVALASFPTCSAGLQGTMRCATNGSSDGGVTTMQCVSGGWVEMGSGGGGSSRPDTCTGDYCMIGDGGPFRDPDGGWAGVVRALRFEASIAGNGTTAFMCRNQTAASSPCLNNPSNIMELFTTPPNKDQSLATFPDFLFLSQAPDGGTRTAGYLLGVLSGPSSAENPQAGITWNGGVELNLSNQGGGLKINGAVAEHQYPQGYGRYLAGRAGASGPAFLYWQFYDTEIAAGDFVQYYNKSGTQFAALSYQGGPRLGKAATGSLETSGAATEGTAMWDDTLNCLKTNNGAAWSECIVPNTSYWSATCFGLCSTDTNFTGGVYSLGGTINRVTCSWGTAGSGGSTGFVVKLRNVTDGTDGCSCTVGACNIAANTPTACSCTGGVAFTTAKQFTMRMAATSDCVANPQNVICTASVVP